MSNGSQQPDYSTNQGGTGIIWLLVILLLLLAAGAVFLFVKYSSQTDVLEQRENHIRGLEQDLKSLQDKLEAAQIKLDTAEKDVDTLESRINELDKSKRSLQDIRKSLSSAEETNLKLQKQLGDCAGKFEEATKHLKDATDEASQATARADSLAKELESCQKEQASAGAARPDNVVSDLTKQLQDCRTKSQELAARLEQQMDCDSLAKELDDLRSQDTAENKAERLQTLQHNLDQCRAQAAELLDKTKAEQQMSEAYESLIQDLKREIQEKEVAIERFKNRVQINILGRILFTPGSTKVTDEGKEVLKKILPSLGKVEERQIYVVGHTDDVAIGRNFQKLFPTNWELSSARASAVVRYVLDHSEIKPDILAAVGASYFQPEASNDTAEGRASNRRVEIIIGTPLLRQSK